MSYAIELTEEQYAAVLRAVAARPGATIESLVAEWTTAIDPHEPQHYYDDVDDMFRALGAGEDVIAEGERIFREHLAQDEQAREGSKDANL